MAPGFGEAAAQAASLTLKIESATVDTITFRRAWGEELPVIEPVLKTLAAIHERWRRSKATRRSWRLYKRSARITACFIVKSRQNRSSDMDVAPVEVEGCVEAALRLAERCNQQGKVSRVLKSSSEKAEIDGCVERACGTCDRRLGVWLACRPGGEDGRHENNDGERVSSRGPFLLSPPPRSTVGKQQGLPQRASWALEVRARSTCSISAVAFVHMAG